MTRIKKRRSGKKRVSDRKKATEGRRSRVKKEPPSFKKDNTAKSDSSNHKKEPVKGDETAKKTTRKRSAGLRRIAASKNIAPQTGRKKETKPAKHTPTGETPVKKGFAPWNKGRHKKKD